MNKEDLLEIFRSQLQPADTEWDRGWNNGLQLAINAIQLHEYPSPVPRDYTSVFNAWRDAI